MTIRLTKIAQRDIDAVARETVRLFGPEQARRYRDIIKKALEMAGEDPWRASSQARDELFPGLRSLHLQLAARRRKGAAHVIYYLPSSTSNDVIVLRLLHDTMEPKRWLARALAEEG